MKLKLLFLAVVCALALWTPIATFADDPSLPEPNVSCDCRCDGDTGQCKCSCYECDLTDYCLN
jgi:hypothetical protein